ncbi:MAG: SDR family oxidoreductase [Marmoricola sp.]
MKTPLKVAVAGGTGVVGTETVRVLEARGHEPVVLARATGVDLVSGDGLGERLEGVDAVVDVTSTATTSARTARRFFTTATGHLLTAGAAAGVGHHVLLSIVGIDDNPFGYYRGKVAQEQAVRSGPVPWTIVRAPQFHEFAAQMIERASFGPLVVVPRMLSAPMAAAEVAGVLVDHLEAGPSGDAPEIAGPRTEEMPDLVRRLLAHRGSRQRAVAARIPGKAGRMMRSGALVPDHPGTVGTQTFDQWLAQR